MYYGSKMYFYLQQFQFQFPVQADNFKFIQENHDDQERMKLYSFTFLTFGLKILPGVSVITRNGTIKLCCRDRKRVCKSVKVKRPQWR